MKKLINRLLLTLAALFVAFQSIFSLGFSSVNSFSSLNTQGLPSSHIDHTFFGNSIPTDVLHLNLVAEATDVSEEDHLIQALQVFKSSRLLSALIYTLMGGVFLFILKREFDFRREVSFLSALSPRYISYSVYRI